MKKSLLLALAALTPLTLSAQSPATGAGGGPAPSPDAATIAPVASPAAPRLPEVEYNAIALSEVVVAVRQMAQLAGVDPITDPINIVISPGLEELVVPALSLRNVSPTEVLSVATTVLGLRMEPVMGDDGDRVVAWLIKAPSAADRFGAGGGDATAGPPPVSSPQLPSVAGTTSGSGGLTGGATASGFAPAANASSGGGFTVPAPVAIAGSSPPGGGGPMAAPPPPAARVFGIASLIFPDDATAGVRPAPPAATPEAAAEAEQVARAMRENLRAFKLDRLIKSLNTLAEDQHSGADIKAYREMEIIIVKCTDPGTLALISEAIEAMKLNVESAKAPPSVRGGLRAN